MNSEQKFTESTGLIGISAPLVIHPGGGISVQNAEDGSSCLVGGCVG